MAQEIERKWLLDSEKTKEFIKNATKMVKIVQTYITLKPEELRFRKIEHSDGSLEYVKTIKKGHGFSREEIEINVSKEIYENETSSSNLIVRKNRYYVDGFEVDVYPDGLITMEREYSSEEEAISDVVEKDFIIKEITGNKEYSNATIAQRGI